MAHRYFQTVVGADDTSVDDAAELKWELDEDLDCCSVSWELDEDLDRCSVSFPVDQ